MTRELPGRLPVERMYPAGLENHSSRMVTLPSGMHLHIIEAGPATGTPVVLVHGWGCWAYVWRYQIAALAAVGYHVIAPDLPGHGRSDKPHESTHYTRASFAAAIAELLDAIGVRRAVIAGHSMGGAVATELAFKHPDLVSHLILVSPVGFGRVRFVTLGMLASPRPTLGVLHWIAGKWAVRLALKMAYAAKADWESTDLEQYWAPSRHPEFAKAMRHLLHHFGWDPLPRERIARLTMPRLIVFGTRDRFVRMSEDAVAALSGDGARARVVRLKGIGHVPMEESPVEVTRALENFLSWSGSRA